MAIVLAKQFGTVIQFDEPSQTPFFTYNRAQSGIPVNHIVWSVNPTSMDAILKIITDRGLNGSGLWNVMAYTPQIWLVINSQYEIDNIYDA
jgi:spore germination protein